MGLKTNQQSLKGEVRHFIIDWNNKFPLDFWWRKKYNIPFGSKEHRSANFINMIIEFEEIKIMLKETDEDESGEILDQGEIDDDYENLEI